MLSKYPTMACEQDDNNNGKTALRVLAQKATHIANGSPLRSWQDTPACVRFSKPGPILTIDI